MPSSEELQTPPVGAWVHTDDLHKYPHLKFTWAGRVDWHSVKELFSWDWKDYADKPNKAPQPTGVVHDRDLHMYPDTHFEVAYTMGNGDRVWKGWSKTPFPRYVGPDRSPSTLIARYDEKDEAATKEVEVKVVVADRKRKRSSVEEEGQYGSKDIQKRVRTPSSRGNAYAKDNLTTKSAVRASHLKWTAEMRAMLELIMTKIEAPPPAYELRVAIFDTIFADELEAANLSTVGWARMQTQRGTRNDGNPAKRRTWEEGMEVLRSDEGRRLLERVEEVAAELRGEVKSKTEGE
ncbi:hypothetical protein B0A55_02293 [Friedmanniomyces simplex]|uniref:Uncharacterized protein n=1 Tax=Friedmanniomyces simplex TaxID=329884 RepID=A0A4U0Y341_9PEZI|nr:hypothetical protein B0A55_02293 [Friedmanniomyces simplex]